MAERLRAMQGKREDHACDLAKSCRKSEKTIRETKKQDMETAGTASLWVHAASAEKAGTLATRNRTATASSDKKEPKTSSRGQVGELTVFEAYELCGKFNLPVGGVTVAWKMFKRYDHRGTGSLHVSDFQLLIRSMLRERYPRARDIPRELFQRVPSQKEEEIKFVDFLMWITQHAFSEFMLLSDEQRMLRKIAKKFARPVPEVEGIKREFDKFDENSSGSIEYSEFNDLLNVLIGVRGEEKIPASRIKSFWRELDTDRSGEVSFAEFIPWYIGYFSGSEHSTPLEEYYRNIRPTPFLVHIG